MLIMDNDTAFLLLYKLLTSSVEYSKLVKRNLGSFNLLHQIQNLNQSQLDQSLFTALISSLVTKTQLV